MLTRTSVNALAMVLPFAMFHGMEKGCHGCSTCFRHIQLFVLTVESFPFHCKLPTPRLQFYASMSTPCKKCFLADISSACKALHDRGALDEVVMKYRWNSKAVWQGKNNSWNQFSILWFGWVCSILMRAFSVGDIWKGCAVNRRVFDWVQIP